MFKIMKNLLLAFIVLNAVNVIIQTVKSLVTIHCGKTAAATVNAIAYGFYTVVVVYMVCELPLLQKVLIVGACNFVGVWLVKFAEEKMRKDKLWKVEATIPVSEYEGLRDSLKVIAIPFNFITLDSHPKGKDYLIFNIYCETQNQSSEVKKLLNKHHAKYFVSESKEL